MIIFNYKKRKEGRKEGKELLKQINNVIFTRGIKTKEESINRLYYECKRKYNYIHRKYKSEMVKNYSMPPLKFGYLNLNNFLINTHCQNDSNLMKNF
jgi:hypothetical protein